MSWGCLAFFYGKKKPLKSAALRQIPSVEPWKKVEGNSGKREAAFAVALIDASN